MLSWMIAILLVVQALPLPKPLESSYDISPLESTQETVYLDPVADATVDSTYPDTPLGVEHTLHLFNQGQNETGRILIRFNLAEELPPEAIIDSARALPAA